MTTWNVFGISFILQLFIRQASFLLPERLEEDFQTSEMNISLKILKTPAQPQINLTEHKSG